MATDPQKERSELEHTAQAASTVKQAVKAGKALAGAAKGAAFGPYGLAAGAAWEGKKVIGKVIIVIAVLLLLPVMILMMLPSMLFGGNNESGDNDVWDNAIVEEVMMKDYSVIIEKYEEACAAVDTVMQNAHAAVLSRIHFDFARYDADDVMTLNDPYSMVLPHDSTRVICEYSALTDYEETINIDDLTQRLSEYSNYFFFYMIEEKERTKTIPVWNEDGTYTEMQISYTQVNYTVIYLGDNYISDDIFCLTEDQKKLAADFADSLKLYLDGGDKNGTTD